MIGFFLITAAIDPQIYRPITDLFGIHLVSNFVLGTMILFLFFQVIGLTVEHSNLARKQRRLVATLAAEEFVQKFQNRPRNIQYEEPQALVVLPCYNEEASLDKTIDLLQEHIKQAGPLSISFCIVNDGSADGSQSILEARCPRHYVSHKTNIGVGGVLLTGFEIADKLGIPYVIQCDSDGQHPIQEIPQLLQFTKEYELDLLIGSRFSMLSKDSASSTTPLRILGIIAIRIVLRFFGRRARIADPTSGFRVYSAEARKILKTLMPDDYPEPESIAILALNGSYIREYPVVMSPRETGSSSLQGFNSIRFMVKVTSALLGLRLRTLLAK
jgi:glycosyltransferase involved in cell wall biosynthesis